jgi:diguanylate cyclase (GGDEF)-like protein
MTLKYPQRLGSAAQNAQNSRLRCHNDARAHCLDWAEGPIVFTSTMDGNAVSASAFATTSVLPRVLVADDDPINIAIITKALRGECETVSVTSGAQALERVEKGDIDLILLDIVMPELDGLEVCSRLKSNPATSHVPVIFVTGLDESAEETRGFSVGGVDYITKPIHPAVVLARVRTHLELKRTRDLLEKLASIDPLTGVANRRRFDAALEEEWRRECRSDRWLSLAIADVDHFKRLNDRHGHLAGDTCLKAVAASLARSTRRAGDLLARYGGEEFGLILPNISPPMMLGVIRSTLQGVSGATTDLLPKGETMTISIGAVSLVPPRDGSATEALAVADALLYEAKSGGRDRCVHLNAATQQKTVIPRPIASRPEELAAADLTR